MHDHLKPDQDGLVSSLCRAITLKTALHVSTLSISTDIIILGTFIDIDTT